MAVNLAQIMSGAGQAAAVTGSRKKPALQTAVLAEVKPDRDIGWVEAQQNQYDEEQAALKARHDETLASQAMMNEKRIESEKQLNLASLDQTKRIADKQRKQAEIEHEAQRKEAEKAFKLQTVSTGIQAIATVNELFKGSSAAGSVVKSVVSSIGKIGSWLGKLFG
jgi:hypothetical protein